MSAQDDFFTYARERYQIMLRRRSGQPGPWTDDSILREFRFCNVFREDDKTTTWFREHVREPLRDSPHVLWATLVHRWFNRIRTMEVLNDSALGIARGEFHPDAIRERLHHSLAPGPYITAAYMIKTPAGMNKIDGLLWCLGKIHPDVEHLAAHMRPEEATLEGVWEVLREYPYLGDFMAYEIVTDLRHTALLDHAEDIYTWANPGPGAARGLARVEGRSLGYYNRHKQADRQQLILGMRRLLEATNDNNNWPGEWPCWELRDVEHTLCEFDKYDRVRCGQGRPKEKFRST